MNNPELGGILELFVSQTNEQRHLLIEALQHLETLPDEKSRSLASRLRQAQADHEELFEAVTKAVGEN